MHARVNGTRRELPTTADVTLLAWLRTTVGLTGAKNGCGKGVCGTCTVLVDGRPVRACRTSTARVPGTAIETIEGLAPPGYLHAIQQALIAEGAVQCGFCSPGVIMSAKALLDKTAHPTEREIRSALRGHLCRCTGYQPIVRAVDVAARMVASGTVVVPEAPESAATAPRKETVVGASVRDKRVVQKVTGGLPYAADQRPPEDALIGRFVYSEHASAEFSIDTTIARTLPGVYAVLTAADLPGENALGIIVDDQRAFADSRVSSVSDVLAFIVADDEGCAARAAEAIEVAYTPLEPVLSARDAVKPGAPLVCLRTKEMGRRPDNICHEQSLIRGDVEAATERAAVVVEGTFATQVVDPGFLEPEAGLSWQDETGRVHIAIGTQAAFDDRRQLARLLAIAEERIIIHQTPMGGAFGGKEDMLLQGALALGVIKTGRPVRVVLTREESFRLHPKRHAVQMFYRSAFASDGTLLAVESDVIADTGCYASLGPDILENILTFGAGPYAVDSLFLRGRLVYTNNPPAGAMRGFGVPQVTFAMESQMDEAAQRLDIDPIEIRRRNALRPGSFLASGHRMEAGTAVVETIDAVENALNTVAVPVDDERYVYGLGVASALKNVGFGHGFDEEAGARLRVESDGVSMRTGTFEYGQGSLTALEQLAAQTLGVPYEAVHVDYTETENSPETGPTTASRQTYLTGNAVVAACESLLGKVRRAAADRWGGTPEEWCVSGESGGEVVSQARGVRAAFYAAPFLGLEADHRYRAPDTEGFEPFLSKQADGVSRRTHWSYSFGTQAALVRVERASGKVAVLRVWAAQDCGRAINPLNVSAQIVGGVVQGVGYALTEEVRHESGRVITDNFDTYRMPRFNNAPEVIPIIVEIPDPRGPFGAKGMGEAPLLATAPAVTNAITAATGVRVSKLPVDPELLRTALAKGKSS